MEVLGACARQNSIISSTAVLNACREMASDVAGLPDDNDNNDMYPNRGDCHGSSPIAQKVAALDAGADDYLTKPFGAAELLARVRVSLSAMRPWSRRTTGRAIFPWGT